MCTISNFGGKVVYYFFKNFSKLEHQSILIFVKINSVRKKVNKKLNFVKTSSESHALRNLYVLVLTC